MTSFDDEGSFGAEGRCFRNNHPAAVRVLIGSLDYVALPSSPQKNASRRFCLEIHHCSSMAGSKSQTLPCLTYAHYGSLSDI